MVGPCRARPSGPSIQPRRRDGEDRTAAVEELSEAYLENGTDPDMIRISDKPGERFRIRARSPAAPEPDPERCPATASLAVPALPVREQLGPLPPCEPHRLSLPPANPPGPPVIGADVRRPVQPCTAPAILPGSILPRDSGAAAGPGERTLHG